MPHQTKLGYLQWKRSLAAPIPDLGKHPQQFARKDLAARSEYTTGPDHAELWSGVRGHRRL